MNSLPLLTPEDYFRLNILGDPQISPDGAHVAFLRMRADVEQDIVGSEVCVLSRASGELRELGAGGQPRWSADGQALAFVRAAGAQAEIALWNAATADLSSLALLPDSPQGLAWSPDGSRIAFVMHVPPTAAETAAAATRPPPAWHALRTPSWAAAPTRSSKLIQRAEGVDAELPEGQWQVFLLDVASRNVRQFTFDDFDHGGPAVEITKLSLAGRISWAPDGRHFVMSMQRNVPEPGPVKAEAILDSDVYEFDTRDGSVKRLTRFGGAVCRATLSPDGRWIAFVGFRNERRSFHTNIVHVVPREGGEPRALPHPLGLEIHQEIHWLPDSSGLLALYPHEGAGCLARVDLAGQWSLLSRELGNSGGSGYVLYGKQISVSRDGEVAYLRGSATQTDEVALLSADGMRSQTLTSEGAWLAERAVAPVEMLWLDTPRPMQGWLLRPPGVPADERLPLIVWLHGGPYLAWCGNFAVIPQLWAARGYAVLMLNPPGSLGYGEDYTHQLHHDFPSARDLVINEAVDLAVARGGIDPARVFLVGESAGGVLTSWLIGHTERYKAAAVVYGVMDWTSVVLTQDRVDYYPHYWLPAPPWEPGMQAHYWAHSPLSRVGHVRTPTMVLCGERDWRTPISQSQMYYSALKLCGVDAALVSFPDNNHGLERHPSHYLELVEQVDEWFQRHDR
ncbi:prolyl oligopeptidase family serine peptidase [Pelomonas sp. KK5]|uniref:S9 family peptidase n=1 Tax=Pelomonas sp. KK5 TaxID=1855730 RepID=UPI00097BD432|nr:prolyl oligopeptidase family serine peptidase [Pelomonas sp. KK5]